METSMFVDGGLTMPYTSARMMRNGKKVEMAVYLPIDGLSFPEYHVIVEDGNVSVVIPDAFVSSLPPEYYAEFGVYVGAIRFLADLDDENATMLDSYGTDAEAYTPEAEVLYALEEIVEDLEYVDDQEIDWNAIEAEAIATEEASYYDGPSPLGFG